MGVTPFSVLNPDLLVARPLLPYGFCATCHGSLNGQWKNIAAGGVDLWSIPQDQLNALAIANAQSQFLSQVETGLLRTGAIAGLTGLAFGVGGPIGGGIALAITGGLSGTTSYFDRQAESYDRYGHDLSAAQRVGAVLEGGTPLSLITTPYKIITGRDWMFPDVQYSNADRFAMAANMGVALIAGLTGYRAGLSLRSPVVGESGFVPMTIEGKQLPTSDFFIRGGGHTAVLPQGMSQTGFGEIVWPRFGKMLPTESALLRLMDIDSAYIQRLQAAQITPEMLRLYSRAYEYESVRNPGNSIAPARAALTRTAADALEGKK